MEKIENIRQPELSQNSRRNSDSDKNWENVLGKIDSYLSENARRVDSENLKINRKPRGSDIGQNS